MKRNTIVFIATIIATILGIAPVVTTTLLIYKHTSTIALTNLKQTSDTIAENSEKILENIDYNIQKLKQPNPICNQDTIAKLQKITFMSPEISSVFIALPQGQIICSSMGNANSGVTLNNLQPSAKLRISGPTQIPFIQQPILIIYKSDANNHIYGAMILPQIFINIFSDKIVDNGFVGLIDLDNNHVYAARGIIPEIQTIHHFPQDERAYIDFHMKIAQEENPIIVAKKLRALQHVYVIAAQPHTWFNQILWKQILIFGSVGLLLSIILIGLVLMITRRHLSLAGDLERAIAKREFIIHYQPVINLELNCCTGVEALIRWQHSEDGLLIPDIFIPLAEKNGQIIRITAWLIQQVVIDLKKILHQRPDFHVAINLGARFFETDEVVLLIKSILAKSSIQPKQIILELTERELIKEDNNFAIDSMHQLRNLGVSLALDDFGTGYSSYSYLRHFPFNYLKIDRQFTAAIGTGAITEHLIDSIIDMAQKLQLNIIAEGIETEQQAHYIKTKGVKLVQGWFYAKPLSLKQLIEYLQC